MDVTEVVSGECENFKSYTVHTADLKDCQIYPDQLDIQRFGIISQHGSGAVKINGRVKLGINGKRTKLTCS